jgi:hypothetical protein
MIMHRPLLLFVATVVLCAAAAGPAAADDCENAPVGSPCDDGLFCNGPDQCGEKTIDGRAVRGCFFHRGDPCIGGPECADRCNETTKDCYERADTPCTPDGNVCTDDVCDGLGACAHPPRPASIPCDDGLFCNGADSCAEGECSVHSGDPCAGGPPCADVCNEVADDCFAPVETPCSDDANECTDDVCDGLGVCAHLPNNLPCDDDLFCNGEDSCGSGGCNFHSGDPCAGGCVEICNETSDSCAEPVGTPCEDDGNPCTEDLCMNGGCTHGFIAGCRVCAADADCDDGNPCTVDACAAEGCQSTGVPGCVACVDDLDCGDGDACTADRCSDGRCSNGPVECFTAVSCPFVGRLGVAACPGERIPRSITRQANRAGCRLERAETQARADGPRVSKRLESAMSALGRALQRLARARGRKLSAPCADALAADIDDRAERIHALMDEANGGALLAACTAALRAADTAPQESGPSLCGSR